MGLNPRYHPMSSFRMSLNCVGGRPFVKISAFCSVVRIYFATTPLSLPINDLKKWYLRDKYLLRVDILGTLVDKRAATLVVFEHGGEHQAFSDHSELELGADFRK